MGMSASKLFLVIQECNKGLDSNLVEDTVLLTNYSFPEQEIRKEGTMFTLA